MSSDIHIYFSYLDIFLYNFLNSLPLMDVTMMKQDAPRNVKA